MNLTEEGSILFNPADFSPPLDQDGDGVYHFSTINIAAGVTVRMLNTPAGMLPVVWLASGDVKIDGIINLDGQKGNEHGEPPIPAIGGTDGFNGGVSGNKDNGPQAGQGPGGGLPPPLGIHGTTVFPTGSGGGGGHVTNGGSANGTGGQAYGNNFLFPLIGGSGGAGGGNGGMTSHNCEGGAGSGGSVRLVANTIAGSGVLSASGGRAKRTGNGSNGRIRIEAFQQNFSGSTIAGQFRVVTPGLLFPTGDNAPSIRVISVEGIPVPLTARASFNPADLTINQNGTATLQIEAQNVPVGTQVDLTMFNETDGIVSFQSEPLTGTFEFSTAMATVTIPHGFSRFTIQASFTP